MCGIAGIIRPDAPGFLPEEIREVTRAMARRGPDGEGFKVCGSVALGHRRLSIIDLATGAQPMSNEDATVWITYNGELYNFRELRPELEAAGHVFRTRSDTEVIVHAYEQWGDECVDRFRGMFAFGIADFRRGRLFLARDHFGIKPLYYRAAPGLFAFASEINALQKLRHPLGAIRDAAIVDYLCFQYIPAPNTIYDDIHKLPHAHRMSVDLETGRPSPVERYWELRFEAAAETERTGPEWEEEAQAVIRESVEAHLVSDVPFGVFLSGGVDSTLVAAQMTEILDHPVKAFSIAFDEEDVSELKYAQQAASRLGIELVYEVVHGNSLSNLEALVANYGEPFGDQSLIPTWHVARLARQHVPMVLSGDGGDEAFAGYDSYASFLHHRPGWRNCGRRIAEIFRLALGLHPRAAAWHTADLVRVLMRRARMETWRAQVGVTTGPQRARLLAQGIDTTAEARWHQDVAAGAPAMADLDWAQFMDFGTWLPYDILAKVDVATMANSLESRTPLVDRRVVEFAARLPHGRRLGVLEGGGTTGKILLKRLLERRLGPEFAFRRKQGFTIPLVTWLRDSETGRKMLGDLFANEREPVWRYLNRDFVEECRAKLGHDWRAVQPVWLTLVLGLWLRIHEA